MKNNGCRATPPHIVKQMTIKKYQEKYQVEVKYEIIRYVT